jgi:hypothetical protein
MDLGPKTVAVKRGEYGALLFHGEQVFSAPRFPLADVYDPTGAGDSFAGGFMGYLARCGEVTEEHLRRATIMGSVMASSRSRLQHGRVKVLTEPEINARFGGFRALTQFAEVAPGRCARRGEALPGVQTERAARLTGELARLHSVASAFLGPVARTLLEAP